MVRGDRHARVAAALAGELRGQPDGSRRRAGPRHGRLDRYLPQAPGKGDVRAGQADRYDGWGYDYQNSYGYQDAAYGYDSYYVGMDDYSYYFREGFQRGYEDGYYGRNQYGSYSNGKFAVLGAIIGTILDIVQY